jgi:putative membrane protein
VRALATLLTGLVAVEDVGIMVLEMFLWDHPAGRRIFGMTPEGSAGSLFGRLTAKPSILLTQALPAGLALGAYFLSRTSSSGADQG